MSVKSSGAGPSLRRHILMTTATAMFIGGSLGAWAMTTELSGAVVAPDTEIRPLSFENSPSLIPLTFMMSSGVLKGPFALR